ncbi:UDP-2,3-diacylglucosamine hydrolase [Sphaerotilus hippei]|uniref:UDP-2,3-diacylglucosamine hydrolase n=1 Tax=Sphaerotilus hippei TaxID=744406 RepID=A0A318HCP4_9BURK|nr:UDP-2,3-diacylglucosamine diphosphatase [Sphaerotilus hippei]PXW98745.1 UDP-2,3-diacylglucosamine hydrolase [Sphaerotilus hippei]
MSLAPLPVEAEAGWLSRIDAAPHWGCIDLLSDLHLSPDTPRTTRALLDHLSRTPASAVLLLGDIFEAWVGDDVLDTPSRAGFELDTLTALRAAGQQRWLGFMQGNRDFLFGNDALAAGGLHGLHDPCVLQAFGRRLVLSHGDALCLDDQDYQRFRRQVRHADWQRAVLARPLAERRALASQLRQASDQRRDAAGATDYGDLDAQAVSQLLQARDSEILVHGHTHRPTVHAHAGGCSRWVLSDWDLDHPDAGHPARAEVLRLSPQGLVRIDLCAPPP